MNHQEPKPRPLRQPFPGEPTFPESEFHDHQDVEEQLRARAAHFVKTAPAPEFVSAIIAEHTLRRRRRIHWRVATSAACLLIVGLAFMVKPFWNFEFRMSSPGSASDIVREGIPSVQHSSIATGRNSNGRESSIATEKYETEMLWSSSGVAGTPPSSAHVPVLIFSMDAQGQPMKVSNVPAPSRIETVRLEDLSQPLRQAAYMVLDIEEHSPAQPEL
jgi:hypothetical protein